MLCRRVVKSTLFARLHLSTWCRIKNNGPPCSPCINVCNQGRRRTSAAAFTYSSGSGARCEPIVLHANLVTNLVFFCVGCSHALTSLPPPSCLLLYSGCRRPEHGLYRGRGGNAQGRKNGSAKGIKEEQKSSRGYLCVQLNFAVSSFSESRTASPIEATTIAGIPMTNTLFRTANKPPTQWLIGADNMNPNKV